MPTYLKYEYIFFIILIKGRIRIRIFFQPDPYPWKKMSDPHPWIQTLFAVKLQVPDLHPYYGQEHFTLLMCIPEPKLFIFPFSSSLSNRLQKLHLFDLGPKLGDEV